MRALLRSIWAEPRPTGVPPLGPRDWLLTAAIGVAVVIEGLLSSGPDRWFAMVATLLLAPTLVWRRQHPLWMVVVAFGGCALAEVAAGRAVEQDTLAFVLLLVYALFRWGAGREVVLGSPVILAKLLLSWPLGYIGTGDVVAGLLVLTAVAALGTALRYRATARARELDRVRLLERERLARDLHDTVAHHVSAMAIRAQAGLATVDTQPAAAADALRVIEAEATRTLAEMRTIVKALRDDGQAAPAPHAPAPRIADLAALAGATDRTGPAIEVALEGDLDQVPGPVDAAVYRLAQESVTNARRHAREATLIRVKVAAEEEVVRLVVTDDGAPPAAPSPGYGLVGMAERAAMLGGTCEAGPAPGRGWTVTAVLPRVPA